MINAMFAVAPSISTSIRDRAKFLQPNWSLLSAANNNFTLINDAAKAFTVSHVVVANIANAIAFEDCVFFVCLEGKAKRLASEWI